MSKKPRNSSKDPGRDLCYTPPYAVEPLLPYVPIEWVLWESARGEGHIEYKLLHEGYSVIATDLNCGYDFFQFQPSAFDMQLTNPPYSIKVAWLERSYALSRPFALLMQVDTMGLKGAQELFQQHGAQVVYLNERVDYHMPEKGWDGAGSQFASAWFTWGLNLPRENNYANITAAKKRWEAELEAQRQERAGQIRLPIRQGL